MQTIISVIGGHDPSSEDYQTALELGKLLAENDLTVACGGRDGIMEAVCKGAKSAGGATIGILPSDDHSEANQYVDYAIVTGMGYTRNSIVAQTGQVVIAIGGHFGTLNEMSYAAIKGRPIIGINSWQAANGEVQLDIKDVSSAREAVAEVLKLI